MDNDALQDLDLLLDDVLSDPDRVQQNGRLIALVGKPVVDQLVNDAKQVLAITGGYQSTGDERDTLHLLRTRVLRNQKLAKHLVRAYDTLEYEAIAEQDRLFAGGESHSVPPYKGPDNASFLSNTQGAVTNVPVLNVQLLQREQRARAILLLISLLIPAWMAFQFWHPLNVLKSVQHVGDTITVDGVSCTLVSVQDYGPTFAPPLHLVTVHVKIVNNSGSEARFSARDFHSVGSSGQIADYLADGLGYGGLIPGGSVEGDIGFAVSATDPNAKLIWQPNYTQDTTNAWYFGLSQ